MGTREVYEEKLRREICTTSLPSILVSDPLVALADKGEWTITPVLHDATAVAGSGVGGMLSAIHGLNTGIPYLQNRLKGPRWVPFLVGLPPLLLFSGAGAAFGGHALPKFAQLSITSYYAASSASHYGVSLLTRRIEDSHTSRTRQERLR
ncbi:hypothetical protein FNV43_RR15099 [Rhamnella rubrinervis]|uniref:Transmembrane protein n=1 Tax=Rhamnella rubrinervis TaxID=2594499 RepID=A0A8K0ECC8_9ROSA|nr:hypothetical protein FNV43_RR15099 [Rhamnella rubrinervis]